MNFRKTMCGVSYIRDKKDRKNKVCFYFLTEMALPSLKSNSMRLSHKP